MDIISKVVSKFVREQKRYTKDDLRRLFELNESGIEKFLKNLKAYGVLKCVENSSRQLEMSDLLDEDIEIADVTAGSADCLYVFTYVGIITLGNRIIKVYPKYLRTDIDDPLVEMRQIVKVLEKYSHSQKQLLNVFNGDDENRSFNTLAIILYLLRDYYEYGIYSNTEDVIEINGEGHILWNKTIDDFFPIIEQNRPYYLELYTKKTVDDDEDYFKRLHETVLTDCSRMLHDSQLDTLFDMDEIVLTDKNIHEFGEKDYILDRIQKELNLQFTTRKQVLLKTLYAYISQDKKLLDEDDGISMYGTNAFHAVWETACAEVLDNKLKTPLNQLPLSELKGDYDPKDCLIDIIQKPLWTTSDGEEKEASDTLIPDLINIEWRDDEYYFLIFDAKYYDIQLENGEPLARNPGVGDVTKQYLYQLAYKDFVDTQQINHVKNFFIMPTEQNAPIDKGCVRMEMFKYLKLEDIRVYQLPAATVFEHYLSNRKIDHPWFDLINN